MKIIKEFKEFISRGNVIDMAVGVIIGGAFTAIVNALVDNILNPLIGIITGGVDFSSLSITIGEGENPAVFAYGSFITAVINLFHFPSKEKKRSEAYLSFCIANSTDSNAKYEARGASLLI